MERIPTRRGDARLRRCSHGYRFRCAGRLHGANRPLGAYRDRRNRKRQFRRLWIQRIGAAARLNGLSYSELMHGLKAGGVDVDRKILADLAVRDAAGFAQIAAQAKKAAGVKAGAKA